MNYVELHLGDWAKAVAHLSPAEEGIYLRLLRRYYADEKPLPADVLACQRLAGARTDDERASVVAVLDEFFRLTEEGYRSKRADEEIAKVYAKKEKAAASAKARWDANAMRTQCERMENASTSQCERNALQSPDTIQDQKQKKEQGARATRLPQDWQPSSDELAWAIRERPDVSASTEAAKFRDYWTAQGGQRGRKLDWSATWRNWIRNVRAPVGQRMTAQPSKQVQAMHAIMGIPYEAEQSARVVLDVNPNRPPIDLLAFPVEQPQRRNDWGDSSDVD